MEQWNGLVEYSKGKNFKGFSWQCEIFSRGSLKAFDSQEFFPWSSNCIQTSLSDRRAIATDFGRNQTISYEFRPLDTTTIALMQPFADGTESGRCIKVWLYLAFFLFSNQSYLFSNQNYPTRLQKLVHTVWICICICTLV